MSRPFIDEKVDLKRLKNQLLKMYGQEFPVYLKDEFYVVFRGFNFFYSHVPETSHEFQTLGSRGPNGQSSVSFLDPKTGILFYALANLNTIACWRPQNTFTTQQQGYVYQDNVTMIFPNDLKVIGNLLSCLSS